MSAARETAARPVTVTPAMARSERAAPELSVVVPTRNERDNVAPLVARLESALCGIDWQVIFVDDDSPDLTAIAVERLAAREPRVRLIRRVGRRGLAGACIEGLHAAAAPCVAVMDADLQHDAALLPRMLAQLRAAGVDVVVASRYVEGGSAGGLTPRRRHLSRLAVRLARLLSRVQLHDPMSGFFVIRRAVFEASAPRLSPLGFKILFDILASAPQPLQCLEVPCRLDARGRGASKLDVLAQLQFAALLLGKLTGGWVPPRLGLFLAVGGSGVLVHLGALYGLLLAGAAFPAAQAGAVWIAMTSNCLLNNAITYRDQRLHGAQLLKGLASFYLVCSAGAVANVALAALLYRALPVWWLAGTAGAALGAAWNYLGTRLLTWRRAASAPTPQGASDRPTRR
jgi:dolichol-phosphate mannosyltransferase